MSLHTGVETVSDFFNTKHCVAEYLGHVAGVTTMQLKAVVSPSLLAATANITGPDAASVDDGGPSIIYTDQLVPPGSLLKAFTINVLSPADSGVITGVGVLNTVTNKYTNLYRTHAGEPEVGQNGMEKYTNQFRNVITLGPITSAPVGITLANITQSKIVLRGAEQIIYTPGLWAEPADAVSVVVSPYRTSGVQRDAAVLAFAGYGSKVGGTYLPFQTGGTFTATASFEWYAPKGNDRVN
jgi:hypothetical protein